MLVVLLYTVLLFVLLTPAILVRLPPNGSKITVAIVHGLVFALVYHLTHKYVWRVASRMEGMARLSMSKL